MTHLTIAELPPPEDETSFLVDRFMPGGSFILDTDPDPQPVWGRGGEVLWAEGEALTIVGGQGVGKTTLAQQIALGRCGIDGYAMVLDYPVEPGVSRTLYLAMDRPKQAARSFRRMVGEAHREALDERLLVWEGPPILDIAKQPRTLVEYARAAGASTIVVDSIKDAAIGLSDDEVGAGWNRARQMVLREGVEMIELHHNRKAVSGAGKTSPSIDDVYGSTWITSGAGSVVLLAGSPGDPVVSMHHLKQPADEVGPLKVVHDHDLGRSSIWHAADILVVVAAMTMGATAVDVARALFETDQPSPAEREKARRRLEKKTSEGLLYVVDEGDKTAGRPRKWSVR